jgi:hypothetical protein
VGQLARNAVLLARLNDKPGVIKALEDLEAYTRRYRDEVARLRSQFELLMRQGVPVRSDLVGELEVVLHRVEREFE